MLNMSIENIRKLMEHEIVLSDWHSRFDVNCKYPSKEIPFSEWENHLDNNCYAFALGLDICEKEVCPDAFIPGNIASHLNGTKSSMFKTERGAIRGLLRDFRALGLEYKEISKDYPPIKDQNNNSWDILFYIGTCCGSFDMHFVRVGKDGLFYHKPGWIKGPRQMELKDIENNYHFVKRYRLSLNK